MPSPPENRMNVVFCATLAERGVRGDPSARSELGSYLWTHWLQILRGCKSLGVYASSDDDVLDVATQLFEKIVMNDGQSLKLYERWQLEHPQQDFGDWMRIVVANAARDHVRRKLGARDGAQELPSRKRLLNEFGLAPSRVDDGFRPPYTEEQTVRQLLEFAQARLPVGHVAALSSWLSGADFDEIDQALGLAAGQGRRLLRAAIAVLRRQFHAEPSEKSDTDA